MRRIVLIILFSLCLNLLDNNRYPDIRLENIFQLYETISKGLIRIRIRDLIQRLADQAKHKARISRVLQKRDETIQLQFTRNSKLYHDI